MFTRRREVHLKEHVCLEREGVASEYHGSVAIVKRSGRVSTINSFSGVKNSAIKTSG